MAILARGYSGLCIAFALIYYDCIPNLIRSLIYHMILFSYIVVSIAFRNNSGIIKIDEGNFMLFMLIIGIGTSYVLIKLRYTYLYQTLSFEKTIKSWKKVMDLCEIGISIENKNSVQYRNDKYHLYTSRIKLEEGALVHQIPSSQNYIVIHDSIYFAGSTSKLSIIKDITEIKKAEKSKYYNLLIATITHELRTPLNIIMAILELFIDSSICPSIKNDAAKALCAASLQETLINDILDMAKLTNGNLVINAQPTEIQLVLNNVFELFKFKIDKAINFSLIVHPQTPSLLSLDERRYKQILLNLLSNASKFTTSGFIKMKVKYKGSMLITSVKDSGIGIRSQDFSKIFTQFGMLENNAYLNKSGTGLGLNLCKSLACKMGGDITFTSQYNKGTKFTFYVEASVVIISTIIKNPILTNRKLVIVDVNNMNIEVLKSFASKANVKYLSYNNSEIALTALQKESDDFIGFFDLNMPNINGYDLAHSIKDTCGRCKLIAVTGEDSQKVYKKCIENGFDEIIEKPVSYKKFCACLQ